MENPDSRAASIAAQVKISTVYEALTGARVKHRRGVATWRGGKAPSVSFSDEKGTWFDHAAGEGGGVLSLVARVHGCNPQDALRWLAGFAGVPLDDRPLSPGEKQRYARDKRRADRDLPIAQMWRRAAVQMAEQIVAELKTKLWDTTDPEVDMHSIVLEIQCWEIKLARWRGLADSDLVQAYRAFLKASPKLSSGMLKAIRRREGIEGRVAWRWIFGIAE